MRLAIWNLSGGPHILFQGFGNDFIYLVLKTSLHIRTELLVSFTIVFFESNLNFCNSHRGKCAKTTNQALDAIRNKTKRRMVIHECYTYTFKVCDNYAWLVLVCTASYLKTLTAIVFKLFYYILHMDTLKFR